MDEDLEPRRPSWVASIAGIVALSFIVGGFVLLAALGTQGVFGSGEATPGAERATVGGLSLELAWALVAGGAALVVFAKVLGSRR